jgi:hypothetical protein
MPRKRDSQRSKLYRAEQAALGNNTYQGPNMDLASCQVLVNRVIGSAWWKRRYGLWPMVQVEDGRGSPRARVNSYHRRPSPEQAHPMTESMRLPVRYRRRWVILHELAHVAHCVVQRRDRVYVDDYTQPVVQVGDSPHGWQFARIYLELVRWNMGREAHDALREQFRVHRVKYKPPRQLSPKVRERARQRMLALRRDQAVVA